MEKEKPNWLEVARGKSGWHASKHNHSSDGGTFDKYVSEAAEGALVHDGKNADTEAFVRHVISGPMIGHDLPPGTVDKFSKEERDAALFMLPGLSGGFDTMAILAQNPKFSGLDRVSIDIFEVLLRKIPGMKIGHVKDGQVVWDKPAPLELTSE